MSREFNFVDMATRFADTQKPDRTSHARVYTSVLFLMFVIVLLMMVLIGTTTYQAVHETRESAIQERIGLNLLTSVVRANDRIGGVGEGTGPEGKSLVLIEVGEERTYETRIYLYEGSIVEEYAVASDPYTPAKATVIAPSRCFEFSYANGLLTIYTDQGTACVALHCVESEA